MRIGLLSDTHDRVPAVRALLARMAEQGVGLVLHAGDYCAPFALQPVRDLQLALAGVFGHNDGDHDGLRAFAAESVGVELHESPHSFEIGGLQLLLVHDIGDVPQRSIEAHQVVVHGHKHQREMKTRGDTLIVNPGEACGWLYGLPTGAIVDLASREVTFLELEEFRGQG
jgi:hypothetical protein